MLCNLMGRFSLWEENLQSQSFGIISLLDLYCMVKWYFCSWSNMSCRQGLWMDALLLNHFQGCVVILDCNVSAIDVNMEFLKLKQIE